MSLAAGISCQRATFTCWHAATGRPFLPLVTWKDLRAADLVRAWNSSVTLRALRAGGKLLHLLTGQLISYFHLCYKSFFYIQF